MSPISGYFRIFPLVGQHLWHSPIVAGHHPFGGMAAEPAMPPIARLDYQSVHRVKACDYRPEQIETWAPRIHPDASWQRRFRPYSADCLAPLSGFFD
jgi:hypothetical protein